MNTQSVAAPGSTGIRATVRARIVQATRATLVLTTALLGATVAPAMAAPSEAPAVAGPVGCEGEQLTVGFDGQYAGLGHRALVVTFTNTGTVSCQVTGYPSADLRDREGAFLAHAAETLGGYMYQVPDDRVPVVTLAPGEAAWAVVEGLAWTDQTGSSCLPYSTLTVTPPPGGEPTGFDWAGGACGSLEIHPVVSGPTPYQLSS